LCFGLSDRTDLIMEIPYQCLMEKNKGIKVLDEKGFGDGSLELKWRFIENGNCSCALKTGISLPTGDHDKGLGNDNVNYSLYFITTIGTKKNALHFNAGYDRNKNDFDEEENLWHFSMAVERELTEKLKFAADIGIERNPDKDSGGDPMFFLAGLIYSITENTSVDLGFKLGLTDEETDRSLMAGLTLCF